GGATALLSAFEGKSDFKIRVHAPEEDTRDVLESLDSLLRIEQAERRADEDDYVAEKQRLLNIQKNRIRDIVQAAFEPLHAMIPNPIQAEVKRSKTAKTAAPERNQCTAPFPALRGQAVGATMRFKETDRSPQSGDRKVATAAPPSGQQPTKIADGPISLGGTVRNAAV
ncbi:secreted ookinete, partial [Cystoisospora suis]